MGDDNDFTFCQVGFPTSHDNMEAQEIFPNIGGITINENFSDGAGTNKTDSFSCNDKPLWIAASEKQEMVGSLSFNVIDTSSPSKRLSDSSKEIVSSSVVESVEVPVERKTAKKNPAARAKVPFEKGYSQMDWLKLTRTHPDLAGLKGQTNRRLISMDEVKQHKAGDSIWTVLKGRVYNISPYMKFHPGGVDMLMKAAGKDSTSLFNKYHAWVNFEFLLEKCLVGILDDSK